MDQILRQFGWKCPVFWMLLLAAALCFGSSGCSSLDRYRGESFHDNSMDSAIHETEPAPKATKKPPEFWSFSNKARDIEKDFPDH
jgi:hypothetical protein